MIARVLSTIDRVRRNRYVVTALATNLAVWLGVYAFLVLFPPPYGSEWSVIIPSSDMEAQVSMADVGQASSTQRSSYDSKSLDPRVNYRTIIVSETVLAEAARMTGMRVSEFGKPKVKLIEQGSVMELKMTGDSAVQAQAKATALNAAFVKRITELRADEMEQRNKGIAEAISTSRSNLDAAQHDVVKFKVGAEIISTKQMEDSVVRINSLQQRRLELQAQVARQRQLVHGLATSLGISPAAAGDTIALQSDAVFMQFFQRYAAGAAELNEFRAKWGSEHPQVLASDKRVQAALAALGSRARVVLGRDLSEAQVEHLSVAMAERNQEPLFRDIVTNQAQAASQQAELAEIEQQLHASKGELTRLAKDYSQLDDLERRLKFAEAIFNTTIGKIDVGRAHVFSSYPLVQLLVRPSLPERREVLTFLIAIIAALAASGFATTALTLAWLRMKK